MHWKGLYFTMPKSRVFNSRSLGFESIWSQKTFLGGVAPEKWDSEKGCLCFFDFDHKNFVKGDNCNSGSPVISAKEKNVILTPDDANKNYKFIIKALLFNVFTNAPSLYTKIMLGSYIYIHASDYLPFFCKPYMFNMGFSEDSSDLANSSPHAEKHKAYFPFRKPEPSVKAVMKNMVLPRPFDITSKTKLTLEMHFKKDVARHLDSLTRDETRYITLELGAAGDFKKTP